MLRRWRKVDKRRGRYHIVRQTVPNGGSGNWEGPAAPTVDSLTDGTSQGRRKVSEMRRHGGYRPLGLVWRVGHSNGGAGPRRAEGGCVRGSPLRQRGSGGVIPGKILKLQMRNTAFWCIFSSVPVMYAHGWNPCALWLLRVRRELPRKIAACGGLDWSLRSWTFLCL